MKNILKINLLLALFAVTISFGLTSCRQADNPVSTSTDQTYDLVSYGTLIETPEVSDLSIDHDMKLLNDMEPERVEHGAMFGGKVPMFQFKHIFNLLKLSDVQKTNIQTYFQAHIDCEKAARLAFFQKISAIMEAANVQRQAIIDQMKSGAIDKATAKQQLKTLNETTKANIIASGAIEELRTSLKACTDDLIAKIKSELTADQLAIFENWLANGNKGGNSGGSNGKGDGKGHGELHSHFLYDTLNFTADQITSADAYYKAFLDCRRIAYNTFNNGVDSIYHAAALQRQAIEYQLKAGTIDKETAKALLEKLKEDTQAQVESSDAKAKLDAALKVCLDTYIANLRSIMIPEQLTLFNDLLANNKIDFYENEKPHK